MDDVDLYAQSHTVEDNLFNLEQVAERAIHSPGGATMEIKTTTYIGVGRNKYFAPNIAQPLKKECYPIGFYLNFSEAATGLLDEIKTLVGSQFNPFIFLEVQKFEQEYYTYLYISDVNQFKLFLKKISSSVDFRSGESEKEIKLSTLYAQAKTALKNARKAA